MKIVEWDYKDQPPCDEINAALKAIDAISRELVNTRFFHDKRQAPILIPVITGEDTFAVVVAESGITDVQAQIFFEQQKQGGFPVNL